MAKASFAPAKSMSSDYKDTIYIIIVLDQENLKDKLIGTPHPQTDDTIDCCPLVVILSAEVKNRHQTNVGSCFPRWPTVALGRRISHICSSRTVKTIR